MNNIDSLRKAKAKYNKKTYDQINFRVKKGEREKIQARADELGLSLNAYITGLIRKDMEENE